MALFKASAPAANPPPAILAAFTPSFAPLKAKPAAVGNIFVAAPAAIPAAPAPIPTALAIAPNGLNARGLSFNV